MQKTDLLEIKKLFKYPDCSFEKMGFAVISSLQMEGQDAAERIDYTGETRFLTRDDEEQKSFLSLLQKAFCFQEGVSSSDVEVTGDLKKILSSFAFSDSSDPLNIFPFATQVVSCYGLIKSYAIVMFKGAYDIPIKDESKTKTGESDSVYRYIAIMVCPIEASKVGLSPIDGDIKKGDIVRILKQPLFGLLYPSFTNRESDDECAFVCCRKEDERELANNLFKASVPVPEKKEKAAVKQPVIQKEDSLSSLSDSDTELSHPAAGVVSGNYEVSEGVPSEERGNVQRKSDFDTSYTPVVNDIDSALLKKRAESYDEEDGDVQKIEVKEDKSVVSNDRVTERDIGGKKFYIIPKDLLPNDILERILELGL